MARFARVDPTDAWPRPVRGWYDTDALPYPSLPDGLVPVPDDAWGRRLEHPQSIDADGRFIDTPAPPVTVQVPATVSNFQCRALLMGLPGSAPGRTLFQDVDAMLHAEGGVALQAWEYANDVARQGALVAKMAGRLGLSDAQVDDLFVTASGIVA